MIYAFLLIIFLFQFLVALAALMFAVFLARPDGPLITGRLTGNDYKNRTLRMSRPLETAFQ